MIDAKQYKIKVRQELVMQNKSDTNMNNYQQPKKKTLKILSKILNLIIN